MTAIYEFMKMTITSSSYKFNVGLENGNVNSY